MQNKRLVVMHNDHLVVMHNDHLVVIPAEAGIKSLEKELKMKKPCVYILANKKYGGLYIGVTARPIERIWMHKNKLGSKYAMRKGLNKLVYYELHATIPEAIKREKQMKKWYRQWKIDLIESVNPDWTDLYFNLL